jgi:hypothetical protein
MAGQSGSYTRLCADEMIITKRKPNHRWTQINADLSQASTTPPTNGKFCLIMFLHPQ